MHWRYNDTEHAVRRGLTTGVHILERGVAIAGTAKAAYDFANQVGAAARAIAPLVAAAV